MRRKNRIAFTRIDATEAPACLWQEPRSDLAGDRVIKVDVNQVTRYGSHLNADVAQTFEIICAERSLLPLLDSDYF
jgi:hypothetical protein